MKTRLFTVFRTAMEVLEGTQVCECCKRIVKSDERYISNNCPECYYGHCKHD